MATLWQDIKYGIRMLAKRPAFTITAVLILALAIGANAAVFSVVHAVLFKALPYDQPDKIVRIWEHIKPQGVERIKSSHRNILYWHQHNQVFEHIAGARNFRAYITGLDRPYHLEGSRVSSCFFSVMGAQPMLGRSFLPEDEQSGRERVVILSYHFWRDRMGRDPQALGKSLILDNESYTIIGVMPPDFRESLRRDAPFWVPLVLDPESLGGGTNVWARLKQGVALTQAQTEMSILEDRLIQEHPSLAGRTVTVTSLLDEELGDDRTLLYLLWTAVGLVLLVACANAAGLFLVHGRARQRELTVRSALGASQCRIVQQMLTEGLLVSIAAGALGVLIASWIIRILIGMSPTDIPRITETRLNLPALLFSLGVTLLTGLAISLLPALRSVGAQVLRSGQTEPSSHRRWTYLPGGLVIAQIAMALVLLIGVGMLTQSLIAMQREDLGFQPEHVLVASIELPQARYPDWSQAFAFFEQLRRRVQSLPDVQTAALVQGNLILGTGGGYVTFVIDGRPPTDPNDRAWARRTRVSPQFFQALGLRILKGRGFTQEDIQSGGQAVIINTNLARKYFVDTDPIGQRIEGSPIVGVVSAVRDFDELSPTVNEIITPITDFCYQISDLIVRTHGDPARLADVLRAQVAALDKYQEISTIQTLEVRLSEMLAPRRFMTLLFGLFAQVALLLSVVGLYGLLQYVVTQRTRDIGIRMALGATQGRIVRSLLCQGILLLAFGTGAGLLGGIAASRLMASWLYEASPTDPAVLVTAISVLSTAALLATWIPARRAARIDPMQALRYE